ncbi:endonuclease 8-like 1 isoform X1 [Podarcis raffonei]|uniref:endonuclease 8-like 1 isoform X1 n=1 Tax=Podarcis raffonei TaxID=65483 RepID=UPI0023293FEF|nr:endonuclease 8-like 1 isoform X1 [Podarcis raffonei]XP_053258361.1 endonuclease 8-like 1 isoform X1 [Podarcis raffonei]
MPEGPELFLNSRYINEECGGLVFSGKVEKSEVSKNPEVPFESDRYLISAVSRGKELKLTLTPLKQEGPAPSKRRVSAARGKQAAQEPMDIIFRFGMSGNFKFVPVSEMPKHAHLRFYTRGSPPRALCFVDFRRFGRWEVSGSWQVDRGPCVMLEYEKFRENVLRNLLDKAFDKPICEALLNQKFFNGVGNYLRAEILYRLKIPPFEKARTVLEDLKPQEQSSGLTSRKKVKPKQENPDLLELCHLVPMEVVNLGGKGYDPVRTSDYTMFLEWTQCYFVPGMQTLRDANGRTIWFQGNPGPMAPKGGKPRKRQLKVKPDPDTSSSKVTKQETVASIPQKDVVGTRKSGRKKGNRIAPQTEDHTMVKEAKVPNTRTRRKGSALQQSPVPDSVAESQKRRTSTRKTRGKKRCDLASEFLRGARKVKMIIGF